MSDDHMTVRRGRTGIPRRSALVAVCLATAGLLAVAGAAAWAAARIYSPPACPLVTYRTLPGLLPGRLCMNVGVKTHGTEPGTYLFMTPAGTGAGLFRDDGTLVWWLPRPTSTDLDEDMTLVHFRGHPYLAVWSGLPRLISDNNVVINPGIISLYDQHYQLAGRITAGRPFAATTVDLHEFRVTPQDDALIGIYDPVKVRVSGQLRTVVKYVVQKVSLVQDASGIHTGRVLFSWDSLRHVPVAQSHIPDPGSGLAWDYFHGNAVVQDTDGNLLVSGRNTWGIYKIAAKSGRVLWEVGARNDPHLRIPWCYQHDIEPLGANEYSLFDDGGAGWGCMPGKSHAARALILKIVPGKHGVAVTLLHAYTHRPGIDSGFLGSVERTPNGDVLSDWGNVPEITEFTANGRSRAMDLSISGPSYRGFRFPWVGTPLTPPTVIAKATLSAGTQLWVSWNGSTQVVAWRVLGGLTPSALVPVSGAIPKSGFETAISLNQPYPNVAVQALGAGDHVLATSKTVSTGSPG